MSKYYFKLTRGPMWIVAITCITVIGLWFYWLFFIASPSTGGVPLESAGQKGDSFGSLNTLFTGLALCGLVYTILIQKRELNEASRQSDILKKQQYKRDFIRQFYSMMGLLNDIAKKINDERLPKHKMESDADKAHWVAMNRVRGFEAMPSAEGKNSHYFRYISYFAEYILNSELDDPVKDHYATILVVSRSDQEWQSVLRYCEREKSGVLCRFVNRYDMG